MAVIVPYVQTRYNLIENPIIESVLAAQKAILYSEIEKKTRHAKLYKVRRNELASSMWLRFGNIIPQDEARYCQLQDRNMFGAEKGMCQHCRERVKTVDHLATQCEKNVTSRLY
ncbi:unnamed protein product [Thelazia callipaeda]|uniref:Uncharacterized protein n=1 Tax=Thelazia callipaeda TaxID=103827 RepID=A0A3P7K8U6_THECL|nr:unnamed protein product [Thelazia callipaeda]